ncbi:hypothetical protein [Actinomadura meridiana]|uniref:hypothetical protein n=1 Tax=Actinomadura meridiana TaxID=559626 RepID=UPI0031EF2079
MDEERWRGERAALNAARGVLGERASRLYPGVARVAGTALLCREGWIPDAPVPLEDVRLEWDERAVAAAVRAPVGGLPGEYRSYSEAMAALSPPKVFEDRPCYRLLDVGPPVLRFGAASFFEGVDVVEAVAHELAAGVDGLPLRRRIGDPCDLGRRTVIPAVTTLTVTTSGRYVLHWRDPAKVAHAGGLHQVMPVGCFQPLGDEAPDVWQCMVREYAEELLGAEESYGPGFVQEEWGFHRTLTSLRDRGLMRVRFLGVGVDPLSLAVDLLTVAVIEDEAFREVFGGLVAVNEEGVVSVRRFDGTVPEPMQPAGAAALRLAWRHRRRLGISPG